MEEAHRAAVLAEKAGRVSHDLVLGQGQTARLLSTLHGVAIALVGVADVTQT